MRPLRDPATLRRLFHPRSIAIVGASANAASFGARTLANLTRFGGSVWPVNARYPSLGDRTCYPDVAALPDAPDCVVIATPRETVEPIVRACIERGAGGIVLYASGYAETAKPDRVAAQARLAALVREAGIPLVGPNTIGIANYLIDAAITFSAVPWGDVMHAARIGVVSQSGALGFALAQARERGVAVSHALTAGNSADLDVADEVAYLAADPDCKAIACIFEGMADPARFIAAAELAWRHDKPLVVHKIAAGTSGAEAAMSHTGSLAGSHAAYVAALSRAGAIVVDDVTALMETAAFLAKAPAPSAHGVAVVATSGGACIMAADSAEHHDVPLPQPADAVHATLASIIPEFGSARNPCDVTAQVLADPASLATCAEALLSDPAFGVLLMPQVYAYDVATPRIHLLADLARKHDKMACNVWVTQWLEGPGARETEAAPRMALFRSMDRCFATIAAWHRRDALRRAGPREVVRHAPVEAVDEVARALAIAQDRTLAEREAKVLLAAYGVPVVPEALASDADSAVAAAEAFGYPVALKVESPALPHKTEAGVIRLGLRDAAAVRLAWREVMANARRAVPEAAIRGVLVQPMVRGDVEVLVGARIDPLFGPLVIVGLGGVLVEVLRDTALALAPLTATEARAMLEGLKGARLLRGFRGSAPVDLDRLADIVVRIGEFAADQRGRIAEVDVNPLVCAGDRIVAVDALVVRST